MATEKSEPKTEDRAPKKQLTWQQKLEQGVPFNSFDETKADADFNYRQRLRDETSKQEFEAKKQANRDAQRVLMSQKKGNE
jgi:hypothetical protein